jgi:hypothetical protein
MQEGGVCTLVGELEELAAEVGDGGFGLENHLCDASEGDDGG